MIVRERLSRRSSPAPTYCEGDKVMIKMVIGIVIGITVTAGAQVTTLPNPVVAFEAKYVNAVAHGWTNNGFKAIKVNDSGEVICAR